jgi:hypothetical protein
MQTWINTGFFLLLFFSPLSFAAAPSGKVSDGTPEAEFQAIVQRTEEIRGLEFKEPVPFERLSRDGLVELLGKELSREYSDEDWKNFQDSMVLLGAIPPSLILDQFFKSLLGEQVAGLYDPHTKKLYVVGDLPLEVGLVQIILEHELTHALTDQHFGLLNMPIEQKDNDDRALAALAVVEGDATLSMLDYGKDLEVGSMMLSLIASLFVDQETYSAAPEVLQAWTLFPYIGGETFLLDLSNRHSVQDGRLVKRDHAGRTDLANWEVINQAYTHPPESTEQILHPAKYNERHDPPVEVSFGSSPLDLLGEGWSKGTENTLGELLLKTLFMQTLSPYQAETAAEGWGGDRYLLARDNKSGTALYWRSVWDTDKDAAEFREAAKEYARGHGFGGEMILSPLQEGSGKEVSLWIVSNPATADRLRERNHL